VHTVKTSIITDRVGQITGYGITVEAETTGDPDEIQASIASSFEMIRSAIASQIAAQADPPPGYAPAEPPAGEPAETLAATATNGTRPPAQAPTVQPTNGKRPTRPTAAQAPAATVANKLPATVAEAKQRFFDRYGTLLGGRTWRHVREYHQTKAAEPTTIQEWFDIAQLTYDSVQTD
jgi:hypothetical protein